MTPKKENTYLFIYLFFFFEDNIKIEYMLLILKKNPLLKRWLECEI